MLSWSPLALHFNLQLKISALLLGISSALKLTVPSHTLHGTEGQPLNLPVDYNFNITVSDIQIIWLFEKPPTIHIFLLSAVNQSVVPDLEYMHRFTLSPPSASLLIKHLNRSDEGTYIVKINVHGNRTISASGRIRVTVDVPVTKPLIYTEPPFGVVEKRGNITLKCAVEKGTRIVYQWMKNGNPIEASANYSFSVNKDTLSIAPVVKEAIGNYSCLAANPVSAMESDTIMPTIYYGPYGLTINTDKGQKVGRVFTLDKGEAVRLYCSADSNPPNIYSWIRKANNSTHPIKYGRSLEVASEKVTQKTEEYTCSAYNNMTENQAETHIIVIIIPKVSICLLILWKRFQPHKGMLNQCIINVNISIKCFWGKFILFLLCLFSLQLYSRSCRSGLKQITEKHKQFQVSSRSVSGSDVIQGQDRPGTIYEVVRHIPEQHQEHQEGT
uniref:HEPACAM family member 2 isoform X2 n=1 Tax=Pogona vitticeps TaxID=103695 RepID=A0ABM5GNQ3_9SAUR